MEDWKELVFFCFCFFVCFFFFFFFFFCKNRLQLIYTSIVSCVYNPETHTFFSVICGVSFFIPVMCIVYVCSVLTSSKNGSYIVS